MAVAESSFSSAILALAPREIRAFIGIAFETAQVLLEQPPDSQAQPMFLMKRLDAVPPPEALIADLLNILAQTALRMWPVWYTDVDFGSIGLSALHRTAAWRKVEQLAQDIPQLSATWAKRAVVRAISGKSPLVRGFPRETQLKQLSLAISRHGLIFVVAIDNAQQPSGALQGLVHALEWLARQGGTAVAVLLPRELADHPALERILFNAFAVEAPVEPPADGEPTPAESADIWLGPVLGRPHPNSSAERKLYSALRQDTELGPLFDYNRRVETIYKTYPIVDVLWTGGRVVVEIDGDSHRQPHQYAADRHRDFQLLVSGYSVLRLTQEEVMRDTARAVEKIRSVVHYRKNTGGKTERRP
jgi:very-short-patch-repair endonuclease